MHYFTCCISPFRSARNWLPWLVSGIFLLGSTSLQAQSPWKVLHYTETTGYNHNTKSQSLAMFNSWASSYNFTVTNDDNGAEFSSLANLQQYAVVVFSNTSGNSGLDATQRANFEAYIAGGGSYLGIHAATDTYRHSSANGGSKGTWDWYAENVAGASVQENPNHTSSSHNNTMTKQATGHPTLANVPASWNKTEEYYYWENGYLNSSFTELLRVGQTGSNSYDAPRRMAHCKTLPGGGRAFYTALGHAASNYTSDQNFKNLIRDALVWCANVSQGSGGSGNTGTGTAATVTGDLMTWHDVVITFDGPQASETGSPNPFMDYRLDVTFQQGNQTYVVPGYFAADGNAANSSASAGNLWRVHFRPPSTGTWTYTASFRQGTNVAVAASPTAGSPVSFNGTSGTFSVSPTNKTAPDLRAKGTLEYVGERYLRFKGSGEYFVKAGADAPENFLAYYEFDNTVDQGGSSNSLTSTSSYTIGSLTFNFAGDGLHHYAAHAQHYNNGDPTWQSGKGKNIIGAINYLSSTGANVFSFLTMNINGDGRDVYPHVNYNGGAGSQADRLKYDVSKLAQWEVVFSHAETKGMYLHFKLSETENDDLLDGSFTIGNERKLYYREMIARFGHHLALNWNLGEEYGGSNGSINPFKVSVEGYCEYIRSIDPYNHPIVLHNWAGKENVRFDPHAGNANALHGISLQQDINTIHSKTVNYVNMSQNAGHPWIVANDEQGPAGIGIDPDVQNNNNQNTARSNVLWGNLMGGGAGVEYYFGYSRFMDDLESESWEARANMWQYNKHALNFFNNYIQFWLMEPSDALIGNNNNSNSRFCLAQPGEAYAIYLPTGNASFSLNMGSYTGSFDVKWYDPRNGGVLQNGSVTSVSGG
ncbi:MAG: ThuA domain-containing protein, partial [Bacteroidia bacterium]|nr:ThuA domain-containing protein [Bacteroidia bacterium]